MSAGPEPPLDPEDEARLAKGIEEFNTGYFFECHDTLEELWQGFRGHYREFFQGLIQASVAFYHVTNGNGPGARSMIDRSLSRLGKYGERCYGVDVASLRGQLMGWRERLGSGDAPPPAIDEPPRLSRSGSSGA